MYPLDISVKAGVKMILLEGGVNDLKSCGAQRREWAGDIKG